jgi:hypothetical protein
MGGFENGWIHERKLFIIIISIINQKDITHKKLGEIIELKKTNTRQNKGQYSINVSKTFKRWVFCLNQGYQQPAFE